jgi:flagellar hook protein FlgE
MDVASIALGGLENAQLRLEGSARRIASATLAVAAQSPADSVDLSAAAVDLLAARNAYQANLQVLRTADEIQREVLDQLA